MLVEADRVFPLETGGVMMGYWGESRGEVVVCRVTGPGPLAVHSEHTFLPDGDYQESKIARAYEESGRVYSYLGDWHTHPREGVYLSPKDVSALRKISGFAEARAPIPIMTVLGGGDPEWFLGTWCYVPGRRAVLTRKSKISALKINFY